MLRTLYCLTLPLLACSHLCSIASAQPTLAERALTAGEFSKAAELAQTTLEAGAVGRAQWIELQRTIGIARAQLGDVEQARRAFVCALALEPDLRLSADEAVEVRSPFMEARGYWSQQRARLAASAALSDDRLALVVSLIDPAALAARVLVRVRSVGQRSFVESSLPTASTMLVSLEGLPTEAGVEYTLALLDENANRLWQQGTDDVPLSAGRAQPAPNQLTARPPAARAEPAHAPLTPHPRRPYYVAGAVSLVVASAALVVAAISHGERERLARRWNDADCDGAGTTRGERCAHERDQIKRAQRTAAGFYALAGVGLAAGVASLLLLPAKEKARQTSAWRCQPGPGLVGVECGTSF